MIHTYLKTLICLFLIPTLSFAQQKKDTKIIVAVSDTSNLFNRVAMAFVEAGYNLEQKDQDLRYISTAERPMKTSTSSKIRAVIKDSAITFTSFMAFDVKIAGLGRTFDPVYYTKSKTLYTDIWIQVMEIAKKFGTLSYSK